MPSKDRCEIEINIRTPRKLKKIGPLKKKSIEWVKLKTERWVEIEGDLDRKTEMPYAGGGEATRQGFVLSCGWGDCSVSNEFALET